MDAIIALGQSFNLHLCAEGIETAVQAEPLKQRGCHYGQGAFYGLPLPAAEVWGVDERTKSA